MWPHASRTRTLSGHMGELERSSVDVHQFVATIQKTNGRNQFQVKILFIDVLFLIFFFFFFFSPCCRRERVPVAEAFARLVERLHIKVPEGRHVVGVLDTSQDHHLEQIFTTIVSEIQEERKLCVGFEPALG